MVIATSITADYLERSQPFFKSVMQHFPGKRFCFTIGFKTDIDGWVCIETPYPECKWQPGNRPNFYSLQHGEFIKYHDFDMDEMILFVDSDMILQRPWDLEFPTTEQVLVTQSSFPQLKLCQVVKNLGLKRRPDKFFEKYKVFIQREFCTCFLLAKTTTWKRIYACSKELYPMLNDFNHHAAWQLLINAAVSNNMKSFLLPPFICNATWYEGTDASLINSELWIDLVDGKGEDGEELHNSEKVYFNHTKFN